MPALSPSAALADDRDSLPPSPRSTIDDLVSLTRATTVHIDDLPPSFVQDFRVGMSD